MLICCAELMGNGGMIGATHIGSKKEVLEMLDLVQKKGIKGIIQSYPSKCIHAVYFDRCSDPYAVSERRGEGCEECEGEHGSLQDRSQVGFPSSC